MPMNRILRMSLVITVIACGFLYGQRALVSAAPAAIAATNLSQLGEPAQVFADARRTTFGGDGPGHPAALNGPPSGSRSAAEANPTDLTETPDLRILYEYDLEIGPVAGLTTAWHLSPDQSAIPLGSTVRFRVVLEPGTAVSWTGAAEEYRDEHQSVASCAFNRIGHAAVRAEVIDPQDGSRLLESVFDVVETAAADITITPPEVWVDPVVIDENLPEDELNEQTLGYYYGESIAALRDLGNGQYRTSVMRHVYMSAQADPPGFNPLIEWRLDGMAQGLGGSYSEVFFSSATLHDIAVGPTNNPAEIEIEIYGVVITGYVPEGDIIPEGVPVTFSAVTDPPGYEEDITWLATTKYGTGWPVLGSGPTFTTQFDNTFGPHPDGGLWQWLGVKGDNATSGQDQKTGACCLEGEPCFEGTAEECQDSGGEYQGDTVPCDPDPCCTLESLTYLPAGSGTTGSGTTGDLSSDNPNGGNEPAFGGGYRFFPDAFSYATRTVSRNLVRIRAVVAPVQAGIPVHFRSFDVDDPSAEMDIDPNGNGRDNRGTLNAALDMPATSHAPNGMGYRGRLRPVGGVFAAEGAVVTVNTVVVGGQALAEVELATTFAPGDNFRVVASCNMAAVDALNDTTSVPTTDDIAGFIGKVTDQLSIWRRFHIEQDRMATTDGDSQAGNITAQTPPAGGQVTVTTNINIMTANEYENGILRVGGVNYPIVGNTSGANGQVTVTAAAALPLAAVTIYQDDWAANGNNAPTTRIDTTNAANLYDMLQEVTVRANNRYADAYLQPEVDDLDDFDSNNVTSTRHIDVSGNAPFLAVFDPFRGTSPGNPPRPANYETDIFWALYLSTAFEALATLDNDPITEPGARGAATGTNEVAAVFLETVRDRWQTENPPNNPTEGVVRSRVAVHELGHQFDVANVPGEHRNDNMNIMDETVDDIVDGDFYFDPRDIAFLRLRHESP